MILWGVVYGNEVILMSLLFVRNLHAPQLKKLSESPSQRPNY